MTEAGTTASADDSGHLDELGYTSEFRREMSPWANFSLGFTYLSPVVSTYTLFAIALPEGGPADDLELPRRRCRAVLGCSGLQRGRCAVPDRRRCLPLGATTMGPALGMDVWMGYLVALLVMIAAVAYGAGLYLAIMVGSQTSVQSTVACAIAIIVLATLINYGGTRVLSAVAIFGFSAELIGALIVGFWLLFTERYHGLGVLFDDFGTAGDGSYLPVFLAAGIIGLFHYYGSRPAATPPRR